jgi:heterodisulfide reductase subunit A-like polyferredoxin
VDLEVSGEMKKYQEMTMKERQKYYNNCILKPMMNNLKWHQRIYLKIYSFLIDINFRVGNPFGYRYYK